MKELETNGSEEWVTKAEIAARLKCTPRYVNMLMKRGILPYLKTRGLLRFDPEACSHALQSFKTRSRFEPNARSQTNKGLQISTGTLTAPSVDHASAGDSPDHGKQTNPGDQTICARVFASPEQAMEHLQQLMIGDKGMAGAEGAGGANKEAPVTVIVLQSTPCV